jgi:PIN domain nuclease of toxin-antitoxin system
MKLLLDTCTFLWLIGGGRALPARVVQLYQSPETEVYLSTASAWEIAVKYASGRLPLPEPPDRFVPAERTERGIRSLAFDEESAFHVTRLPGLHRDPFDRMLVSQAIVHGLTLVTPDPLITQYPARTLW